MNGIDISSDPSSTSDASDSAAPIIEEEEIHEPQPENEGQNIESEKKEKIDIKKTALPIVHIVLSEVFIPVCLILGAIATLSVVGMVFILLFMFHVLVLSFSKRKTTGIRVVLIIELLFFLAILVFAIIIKIDKFTLPEVIHLIGFDLVTCVSSKPDFGMSAGVVGIIFVILDLVFSGLSDFTSVVNYRSKVFNSHIFKSINYLLWYLCLAYIGSATSTYLFAPLLLFFIYTNITHSLFGQPLVNKWLQRIVYIYSVLYSMFLVYQISPIAINYPISEPIKFFYTITDQTLDSLLGVIAVLFGYLSLVLLISPLDSSLSPAKIMKKLSSIFVVLLYALSMFFAMFFPTFFGILWVFTPFLASFMPIRIATVVFYRIHTILYSLSFFSMIVTFANNWIEPTEIMIAIGLFKYKGNFTFVCCGYFLSALLGQIGLFIEHPQFGENKEELDLSTSSANEENELEDLYEKKDNKKDKKKKNKKKHLKKKKNDKKSNKEEKSDDKDNKDNKDNKDSKDNKDKSKTNDDNEEKAKDLQDNDKKLNDKANIYDGEENEEEEDEEEMKKKRKEEAKLLKKQKAKATRKKIAKKFKTVIIPAFITFLNYVAIAAITVIGILGGFYKDRYTLQIILLVSMIIVLLNLFYKWLFILLQVLMGLLIMANIFFVAYPSNYSSIIPYFFESGLYPTNGMSIPEYSWPVYTLFILFVYINSGNKDLMGSFPPLVAQFLFIVVAILHFLYVFIYETNIFTLLYVLIGIGILSYAVLNIRKGIVFMAMLSSIFVTIQIIVLLFSHFDSIRNLVTSLIPYESIISIADIEGPSVKVGVLAFILFASSIALRSEPAPPKTKLTTGDHIFFEIKMISRNFYFYLTWIFVFGFSVINNYPTFLKFLISCVFIFGKYSAPLFEKIRVGFLVFSIVYLAAQLAFQIFDPFIDGLFRDYAIYLGFFLDDTMPITLAARNGAIGWQLAYIMISVINVRREPPRAQNAEFEELLAVRIYNAICALLHNLLPVIIQISLCISCLSNPSIFGYISYIVLILVVFKSQLLEKIAGIFTLLFNICFIVQYLLWLKCPVFLFSFRIDAIINEWGRFLGIVDVTTSALISNCISAFIFTFYMQYHLMFVDYGQRFNALPDLMKEILSLFVGFTFEIFMSIIMVILYNIPTIDGFFFVVLVACLMISSLLYHYPFMKTVDITSWFTFFVFGARMVSRIPIFTEKGVGQYAKKMLDLPFQNSSRYEGMWIIVFIFERILVHLMSTELYLTMKEKKSKHQAYRYIHAKQLKVIEVLDQEICSLRHDLDIQQVETLQNSDANQFFSGTGTFLSQMENKSMYLTKEENDNKGKVKWYNFIIIKFALPLVDYIIETIASLIPPISESGLNMLTLETLTILLKKDIYSLESGKVYIPTEKSEKMFFNRLPPTFKVQFDSIGELSDFKYFKLKDRWVILIQYIFTIIRRLAFPFMILIILIYTYMKPFIFAMLLIVYVLVVFCSCRLRNIPNFYRIFLIIVMVMFCFRCLSVVDIVKQYINEAENSLTLQQMNIDIFSLFGINPHDSSTIEIFVFLASIWYVVDQIAYTEVFENTFYYNKFTKMLPGFPAEYCYGIIANPESTFGMTTDDDRSFIKERLYQSMTGRLGLEDTTHKFWLLLLDLISLLVLAVCWTSWTTNTESLLSSQNSSEIRLDAGYVFILLIHVLFTFVDYFSLISSKHIILFVSHNVWFLYTILISFYYCQSASGTSMTSSLQFYICLRFISHLISAHKCFTCRSLSVFKYPDFVHNHFIITWKNRFMRYIPFAFEIQMMLEWISKKTFVSLTDYFIVNDIKTKLEIKVAQNANPDTNPNSDENKYKKQNRFLVAGIGLLLLACVAFLPLFFFIQGDGSTLSNPPIFASLEIGISGLPSLYQSQGTTQPFRSNWQLEIASARISALNALVSVNLNDLTCIDFPLSSTSLSFNPTEQDLSIIIALLNNANTKLVPFIKFSFYFNTPTTSGNNQDVKYLVTSNELNWVQKQELLGIIVNHTSKTLESLNMFIPTSLFAASGEKMADIPVTGRTASFEFVSEYSATTTASLASVGSHILSTLSEKNSSKTNSSLTSSVKSPLNIFNENKVNENKVDENKVNENKVNENKVNENKVNENKVNENKVNENKVNENKVNENKVNDGNLLNANNEANKFNNSRMIRGGKSGQQLLADDFVFIEGNEYFDLSFISSRDNLDFLNPMDSLRIMVYSEPVAPNGLLGSTSDSLGGVTGMYIIIVLVISFAVRFLVLGFGDDLWFERMDQPQKLYRLLIAIELFRNPGMPEKEKDMTEELINTLRSHETMLKVTANESVG